VTKTEEIANRCYDVGSFGVVPVHLDDDFAVIVGIVDFIVKAKGIMDPHNRDSGLRVGD
jgi:hypothetical protein